MTTAQVSSGIKLNYFEAMSKRYCSTIYDEINKYQPKTVPAPPFELLKFRGIKNPNREEANKFYRQEFIEIYLDEKWKIELYNRDTFLRLYELYWQTEYQEQEAVLTKLNLFYNKILQTEKPYKALMINLKKYNFPQNTVCVQNDPDIGWDE